MVADVTSGPPNPPVSGHSIVVDSHIARDNTGSFLNTTFAAFSTTSQSVNYIFTLSSQVGKKVAWRIYANDTLGAWNSSSWQYITVTKSLTNDALAEPPTLLLAIITSVIVISGIGIGYIQYRKRKNRK